MFRKCVDKTIAVAISKNCLLKTQFVILCVYQYQADKNIIMVKQSLSDNEFMFDL